MKQTAVEWLEERIQSDMTFMEVLGLIIQAKEMEKEQLKRLLEIIMWYDEESDVRPDIETYTWFMQLYNETFK